jgi:Flp pilus assembly CpaE family ATPase
VVLDCGSSMNEETLAAAAAADHRIIVTGEDRPAVDGAGRRIKALESLGVSMKTTALVVNRAHAKAGVNWSNVEKKYGVRVLGKVRNDWKTVAGALERAALLSQDAPDAAVNRDIDGLADALGVARPEGDDTRGGGLGRSLMSMFGG